MNEELKPGDLVIYTPTSYSGEVYEYKIGVVKSLSVFESDVAFVYYHTGDTASGTRLGDLHKIENAFAIHAILQKQEDIKHVNK